MKWHKCCDESYPDINQRFILVRFREEDKYFRYYIYDECPYGWNILERKNAEFTILDAS